jgi:hypothetical protein
LGPSQSIHSKRKYQCRRAQERSCNAGGTTHLRHPQGAVDFVVESENVSRIARRGKLGKKCLAKEAEYIYFRPSTVPHSSAGAGR